MEAGNKILQVLHQRGDHENRKGYYSTKVMNLSPEKVRVKKFGGYTFHNEAYVLSTITGGYFSEQNFQEWYGVDQDGWIKPGQILVEPNNYSGGKCYWAYFGVTESGRKFVAGGLFDNQKPWWKFW